MPAPKYIPHYTTADYSQWDGDWELWNGVAVAMTPSPFGKHQKALTKLAQILLNALEAAGCDGCAVVVELDWIVSDDTVVRPDLSVCCSGNTDRFIESPPTLIAEILSESTQHKDRTAKRELYAAQGVEYYMLIDLERREIEFLKLREDQYFEIDSSGPLTITLREDCTIQLDLQSLLRS